MYWIQKYLNLEAASANVLFFAVILALVWANSPLAYLHTQFVHLSLFFVNEALMACFFLVVGLELKRSYKDGSFSTASQILLPGIAAIGGMLVPALIYYSINQHNPSTLRGWATPVATDIAFALGVLSLFNKHIPHSLKLFLLALAIFDDIGAIIIIGLFYSQGFSFDWLLGAAIIISALFLLNFYQSKKLIFYLILGILLWGVLLQAHVHPTIAGVILGLAIPDSEIKSASLLRRLENKLHPWVAYLIMPLFALVNAGFSFADLSLNMMANTIVLGIALGLFIGKQCGVFIFAALMIKFKWAKLPSNASWGGLYGVALLCGIGFTMSLFLGTLSFPNQDIYLTEVRVGVIAGSLISGLMGAAVLKLVSR